MELDLCWITVAGKDPLSYFKKYPGRFVLVHVKDLSKLPQIVAGKGSQATIDDAAANFTPVGSGTDPMEDSAASSARSWGAALLR